MANLIPQVERLRNAMQRGWPNGTDELHKEIHWLFSRIEELETALIPFARVGQLEHDTNLPMVNVYRKDCVTALEKIDAKQGSPIRADDFFSMPAEG